MMHDFVKSIVDSRFSGFGSATRPNNRVVRTPNREELSLEHFWDKGSLSDEVEKILEILCSIIDKTIRTYEEDNPLEWARKDIARDHFFDMDPGPEVSTLLEKLPLTLKEPLEGGSKELPR